MAEADTFTNGAEADPDSMFLGSATARLDSTQHEISEEIGDEGTVFHYPDEITLEKVQVACFGGGTARVGVTYRAGSSWISQDAITLPCDGIPLSAHSNRVANVNVVHVGSLLDSGTGAVLGATVHGASR